MQFDTGLADADLAVRSCNERNDAKNGYNNSRYQTGNWSDWDCLRNIDISLRRIADVMERKQLTDTMNTIRKEA